MRRNISSGFAEERVNVLNVTACSNTGTSRESATTFCPYFEGISTALLIDKRIDGRLNFGASDLKL